MNGNNPYSLMPRNTQFLLPLPTKAQRLAYKLSTCKRELQKIKTKVGTLNSEIAFWNEFSAHLKLEYKTTDLALAQIDGRLTKCKPIIITPTTSAPKSRRQKAKTKTSIDALSTSQLTELTSALEAIMKAQEKETN